jgi:hypothetical protein
MSEAVKRRIRWLAVGLAGLFLLTACTAAKPEQGTPPPPAVEETPAAALSVEAASTPEPTVEVQGSEREYQIVTLLPPDAIPAIDDPEFYDIIGADLEYHPGELVLGVELNGEARAYPIGLLAQREIVNDSVGGHPIAVTY